MDNYSSQLDSVFIALADPTRRAVIHRLGAGPASVGDLSRAFPMALPSFMKHLSVLERCGLVRSRKSGRVRTCELVPQTLSGAERWMAAQRALWASRSDRLATFVEQLHQEDLTHERHPTRRR